MPAEGFLVLEVDQCVLGAGLQVVGGVHLEAGDAERAAEGAAEAMSGLPFTYVVVRYAVEGGELRPPPAPKPFGTPGGRG